MQDTIDDAKEAAGEFADDAKEKAGEFAEDANEWWSTDYDVFAFSSISSGDYWLDGEYGAYKNLGIHQIYVT